MICAYTNIWLFFVQIFSKRKLKIQLAKHVKSNPFSFWIIGFFYYFLSLAYTKMQSNTFIFYETLNSMCHGLVVINNLKQNRNISTLYSFILLQGSICCYYYIGTIIVNLHILQVLINSPYIWFYNWQKLSYYCYIYIWFLCMLGKYFYKWSISLLLPCSKYCLVGYYKI